MKFAAERLKNFDKINVQYPKILDIPFTSDTKTHITIHRKPHSNGGLTLHMKGAPEKVWNVCSSIWVNGKILPITPNSTRGFEKALDDFARKGKRVLGCAIHQLRGEKYPDNYKFDLEKKNYPMVCYFTHCCFIRVGSIHVFGIDCS